ncbi:hypothetical protein thsrh120_39180 [Rhizobium sp. No.120]
MAKRLDQPMETVTRWAGLVAEMHPIKLCGDPLDNPAHARIRCLNVTPEAGLSLPAGFSDSNRILQLGDVDSNKTFSII